MISPYNKVTITIQELEEETPSSRYYPQMNAKDVDIWEYPGAQIAGTFSISSTLPVTGTFNIWWGNNAELCGWPMVEQDWNPSRREK